MFFSGWRQRALEAMTKATRHRRRPAAGFRPRLETLEDRRLLAVSNWTGAVSSDWNNPANWKGGHVAGAADTAVFSGAFASPSDPGAVVSTSITVGKVLMVADYTHSLTIGTPVAVSPVNFVVTGTFQQDNGLFNELPSATATFDDNMTQSGGVFIGGGTVVLNGPATDLLTVYQLNCVMIGVGKVTTNFPLNANCLSIQQTGTLVTNGNSVTTRLATQNAGTVIMQGPETFSSQDRQQGAFAPTDPPGQIVVVGTPQGGPTPVNLTPDGNLASNNLLFRPRNDTPNLSAGTTFVPTHPIVAREMDFEHAVLGVTLGATLTAMEPGAIDKASTINFQNPADDQIPFAPGQNGWIVLTGQGGSFSPPGLNLPRVQVQLDGPQYQVHFLHSYNLDLLDVVQGVVDTGAAASGPNGPSGGAINISKPITVGPNGTLVDTVIVTPFGTTYSVVAPGFTQESVGALSVVVQPFGGGATVDMPDLARKFLHGTVVLTVPPGLTMNATGNVSGNAINIYGPGSVNLLGYSLRTDNLYLDSTAFLTAYGNPGQNISVSSGQVLGGGFFEITGDKQPAILKVPPNLLIPHVVINTANPTNMVLAPLTTQWITLDVWSGAVREPGPRQPLLGFRQNFGFDGATPFQPNKPATTFVPPTLVYDPAIGFGFEAPGPNNPSLVFRTDVPSNLNYQGMGTLTSPKSGPVIIYVNGVPAQQVNLIAGQPLVVSFPVSVGSDGIARISTSAPSWLFDNVTIQLPPGLT